MDITIYLKFEGALLYSQDKDDPGSFKPIEEKTLSGLDVGDKVYWKISREPGTLERIRIQKVNKKEGVDLPKGTWKDQWTIKPTKVSDSEYYGEPNGEGATKENPLVFAYQIDYQTSDSSGWSTLDPGVWIPPPPPPE